MSKILFIMNIGFDRQGPSIHLLTDIIIELSARHKVTIISKTSGGEYLDIPEVFIGKDNICCNVIKTLPTNKKSFIKRYLSEIKYSKKCSYFYKNQTYDCVFLQSNVAAFFYTRRIKKYLRCPIVFNVQDIFPDNLQYIGHFKQRNLLYKLLKKIQLNGYRNVSRIITISYDMKNQLVLDGVNPNKISVIFNWSYSDKPINKSISNKQFTVLYAGNIGRMQNIEVILESAKRLTKYQDIRFLVVGDGVYKNRLCEKYSSFSNIVFDSLKPQEKAEATYSSADIIVIPLHENIINTALPSKTATCLRTNIPLVFCIGKASIIGARMSDTSGIEVIDSNDSEALAKIILKYKTDKGIFVDTQKRMLLVEEMSRIRNPKKYVEVIEEAIDGIN